MLLESSMICSCIFEIAVRRMTPESTLRLCGAFDGPVVKKSEKDWIWLAYRGYLY
jgi:hypothetical protein